MSLGLLCLGSLIAQAGPPKISFKEGAFVVSGALATEIVPIQSPPVQPTPVDPSKGRFKIVIGKTSVSFEGEKGLTVYQKGYTFKTQLKAVPTSGKIATKESNEALMLDVQSGSRKLEVSGVSGYQLIDKSLFLLMNWRKKTGEIWLESLVRIDASDSKPQPHLITAIKGTSMASGKADDVLKIRDDNFLVLVNHENRFGYCQVSSDAKTNEFFALGNPVSKAKILESGDLAWTLTSTPYGTNILGLFDLKSNDYFVTNEIRGKMVSITSPGMARVKVGNIIKLINLKTGAMIPVEPDSSQAECQHGILLWSKAKSPQKAVLFDTNFRRLAEWSGSVTTPKTPVKKSEVVKPQAKPQKDTSSKKVPPKSKKEGTVNKASKSTTTKKPKQKRAQPILEVTSHPKKKRG